MKYGLDFYRNSPEANKDIPPKGVDFFKPRREVKEEPKTFKCTICDYSCETEHGIKVHITRKHG